MSAHRENGLYWVFYAERWTVAQYQMERHFPDQVWRMIGDDVGRTESDVETVGRMVTPESSGSKYNYTIQDGDSLISLGFDTHEELLAHMTLIHENSK